MTFEEIAAKAEDLRVERLKIPAVSYSNYKEVLKVYQHILNDLLVLVRNIAQNLTPVDPPLEPPGVELPEQLNPFPTDEIAP